MTDQPAPPLHEQVRTLEADLVMCREQLAQETERADRAEQTAENLRGRAIADEVRIRTLTRHRDKWRDRALQSTDYEQQHGVQLPTPDATNPVHLRWAAEVITALMGSSSILVSMSFVHTEADRLEAAQQQPDTCADTEPDSRVRCQRPKGHPGDHRYEDRYGNGIGWQADADEELIEKAARTLAFAVERNDLGVTESEMWGMCLTPESRFRYRNQARALLAANLLQDDGEK